MGAYRVLDALPAALIVIRREEPGWWKTYCTACDYPGSVAVLFATTTTWQQGIDAANKHLATSHT